MAALPSLRATASLGDLRLYTLEVENVALLQTLLQLGKHGREGGGRGKGELPGSGTGTALMIDQGRGPKWGVDAITIK